MAQTFAKELQSSTKEPDGNISKNKQSDHEANIPESNNITFIGENKILPKRKKFKEGRMPAEKQVNIDVPTIRKALMEIVGNKELLLTRYNEIISKLPKKVSVHVCKCQWIMKNILP